MNEYFINVKVGKKHIYVCTIKYGCICLKDRNDTSVLYKKNEAFSISVLTTTASVVVDGGGGSGVIVVCRPIRKLRKEITFFLFRLIRILKKKISKRYRVFEKIRSC